VAAQNEIERDGDDLAMIRLLLLLPLLFLVSDKSDAATWYVKIVRV
jgi:hypothetical protein